MRATPWILLIAAGLAGCHGGPPRPPAGWAARPATDGLLQTQRDTEPRLQIIICYGPWWSNHSATRITAPGRKPIFWDPGGGFKETDPTYGRVADLIIERPPDLGEWWSHRRSHHREPFMEVLEWDLTPGESERLYDAMLAGVTAEHGFQTDQGPGDCSSELCAFLERYGPERISIPRRWFWPHNLARHLRTQSPDRVLIFHRRGDIVVMEPAAALPATADQPAPQDNATSAAPLDTPLHRDAALDTRLRKDADLQRGKLGIQDSNLD